MKSKKILIGIGIILIVAIITIWICIKSETINILRKNTPEDNLAIKENKTKQIKLVDYEGDNFSMKIPEGWEVTTGGSEMYYTIYVHDPKDERNQIFAVLKAAPLLKSYQGKQWHQWYVNTTGNQSYKMMSDAIILTPATVENFYNNFNNYTNYAKTYEPTYNNFKFPFITTFNKIEEFESNTYMKDVSLSDKTIRATFEDSRGQQGEGLFMASIVDFGAVYAGNVDTSFYSIYNIIFITSAKDEFIDYEKILTESVNTLEYKKSFVNQTNTNGTARTEAALKANESIQAAYDSYNSAWNTRQKTYDITSQKYSDATLGYERVYDKDTGEIYKAYNGFSTDYTGTKYETVTDNMYTEAVSGYIEKVD